MPSQNDLPNDKGNTGIFVLNVNRVLLLMLYCIDVLSRAVFFLVHIRV